MSRKSVGIDKPIRLGRGYTPVYVTVCLTAKAWKRATKHVENCPDFPADLHASTTKFSPEHMTGERFGPFAIITLNRRYLKRGITVASLVAHEVVHCKQFAESFMGTTFDHETEAYYVQHLTAGIMRRIKRFRK